MVSLKVSRIRLSRFSLPCNGTPNASTTSRSILPRLSCWFAKRRAGDLLERRILLLVTDLEIGGTPTVVREVASRLHNPPWVNIHVACLAKMGPVGEQIRKYGVSVT